MIARRHSGVLNLHQAFVAVEAVALWLVLSKSGLSFTTLLPQFAYPLAIIFGVVVAAERVTLPKLTGCTIRPSYLDATRVALRQLLFICGTIFSVVVIFKDPGISRFFLLCYVLALSPLLVFLNRYQPQWITSRFLSLTQTMPTLLVGNTERFPHFSTWLDSHRRLGMAPLGHLSYQSDAPSPASLPHLGSFHDIEHVIQKYDAKQIIMLEPPAHAEDAETLLRVSLSAGCRLMIHNSFGYKLGYPFQVTQENSHSFLTLHDEPLEDPLNRAIKRGLDILVASFVLLLVFPPLALLVAFMQRRQSPGPLFHAQLRTGHNRSSFMILKFRSMNTSHTELNRQAGTHDDRVFPFGRFLRRSSLDEIPQFINVLRGEMSTVGPRPHLLAHSDAFSRDLDVYLLRYFAKPGITGLAQCNGYRGITSTPDLLRGRVQLDLQYIRTWSIWMDLWIILKTARQILFPPRTAT